MLQHRAYWAIMGGFRFICHRLRMNSNEFSDRVLTQLFVANDTFAPPPLNEMQKRNASAVMKEIVVQRLAAGGSSVERERHSRYKWDGGIILSRNSRVGSGFWSNMPSSQLASLLQLMSTGPALFLFCHFDVEGGILHTWAVPDTVALESIASIPENQSELKTLYIDLANHCLKNASYAPNLEPYYRKTLLTDVEKESLAAGIKQDTAAKELSNNATEEESDDVEASPADDELYSGATVEFVEVLPSHMTDRLWHQQNRDRYQQVLRRPTSALVELLRANCIEELDPKVADTTHNISVLKKNDFGRGGFYDHYWAAFYDPASGSKTKSCQLFIIMRGSERFFRYGFAFGNYCANYIQNLHLALSNNAPSVCQYLRSASSGIRIAITDADDEPSIDVEQFVSLLMPNEQNAARLMGTESISIYHEFPLADLPQRAAELADEIGEFFRWLWPFFEGARTGEWVADRSPLPSPIDEFDLDPVDEYAPRTLEELSERSSLPMAKLKQIEEALLTKQQIILTGPPGTSKTYIAQLFARYFVVENDRHAQGTQTMVFMHANWGYEDFFEGIRPIPHEGSLKYESRHGFFLKWIESLKGRRSETRHVLVIDEINRCDTAAVLGELLQLFEYRGRSVKLLSGNEFRLPSNVYIIGTMNSADRSIGRMDLALRRRFLWLELFPDYEVLQKWLGKSGNNPCKFSSNALRQCNQLLEEQGIQPDQQVGHALFMMQTFGNESQASQDKPLVPEALRRIVLYSVVPYVKELCMMQLGRVDVSLVNKIQQTLLFCLDDTSAASSVSEDEPTGA